VQSINQKNTSSTSEFPESLILEPGDQVEGRFHHCERGATRDGQSRVIVVLEVDDVQRSLWLHETALRKKFARVRPQTGELVRIVKGAEKRKSENSRYYWPFEVKCPERPSEVIGWNDPLFAESDKGEIDLDIPIASAAGPAPPVLLEQKEEDDDDGPVPF
jgi:hypothetical protein